MIDKRQKLSLLNNQGQASGVGADPNDNVEAKKPTLKLTKESLGSVAVLIRGCTTQECCTRTKRNI